MTSVLGFMCKLVPASRSVPYIIIGHASSCPVWDSPLTHYCKSELCSLGVQGSKAVAPAQLERPAERPAAAAQAVPPQALANSPAPEPAFPAAAAPQKATKLKLGYRLGSVSSG